MKKENKRIADFLFEIGSMRKLARMHRQTFLTDDMSDNIASHSYRVAFIGWILAKHEKVDPYKTTMMCLLHDLGEARSNDHNWVHKRYITIHEEEITNEQLGSLPFDDFLQISKEYEERKTKEAIVAKDADILDEILLLREYEWQGNKEASIWLNGENGKDTSTQLNKLKLKYSKELGKATYEQNPSDWWNNIWTNKNRT